ncbi:hybrid sensor histidine kinase/response regulator [Singulisphaera acidiphila]|uniref:histidine kinase n=1 Tax=Singulisphaera acidiphila (strain ATCC BAA-1392 / DSM 18658 / VKM B-2454 / MOB10) TaxID=886293 RepID=L0D8I1_SINAD|nr:response regulator [Singulisphaera acidiphila]AGA25175.1 PAS domain S-box [Singulisphaera acidiphila DSM 18658]
MLEQPPVTILLVDDDDAKRYTIAKILKKANFAVREATTGTEALLLVVEKPDLIILDVKLPDISGFEVCRLIKSDPATASIPVLHLSTTFVEIEDKVHGLEGGADGYLTDVLEPLELIATVKALLRARRAEEAAQLTARQWQVTFDAISDGVVLLDVAGKMVQVNQALNRILGKSWNDPAPQTFHEVLGVLLNRNDSPFLRMLETSQREAIELKRGDRWLQVAVDPVRNHDDQIKGALCIISDITDRMRMEEELRQRADELAAADRRKDEFLAMLAHELRNPLAPILNSLEEIRLNKPSDSAIGQALDVAGRQVRHMSRLLDDLLDVSRFTRGKIQLRREPIDLAALVPLAVETARPLIEMNGQELTVTLPDRPVRLEGDPTRLAQVVGNLLNNAAKYSEPGGKITLSLECAGEESLLRVRDTGIGMSAEMLPRVFDLFSQADLSLDRSQGGLGIGLTLVRSLVEMHGGSITASSPGLGHGSEFVVQLPILAAGSPPPIPTIVDVTEAAVAGPRRVLVVDDHKDSALSLARVLRHWGHDVRVVHEGASAIEEAGTYPFDLVLLDIGLPGMDGYQVAGHLRELTGAGVTGPVLVALTGYGQEEDLRRAWRAGFDLHMVKPVSLDDLRQLLSEPDLACLRAGGEVAG